MWRAAQSGGGVRARRRRCGEAVEQGATVVVEHFVAQADAVGGKYRTQLVRAQAQVVDGVAPGQLAHAAARGEAEGVGVEQLAVVGVGLEHHLVDARVLLRIPGQAHVHARLQPGARSEERRVGQEWGVQCRYRVGRYYEKKKTN